MYKSGQKAPLSGQYGLFDKNGNYKKREVTVVKGEPFPPTPSVGMYYRLKDKTIHKSDK